MENYKQIKKLKKTKFEHFVIVDDLFCKNLICKY